MSGQPFIMRARWGFMKGAPAPGQFFKAEKGRTAYEIVSARRIDASKNAKGYNWALSVVRWRPADVPEGATVHPWTWDKR